MISAARAAIWTFSAFAAVNIPLCIALALAADAFCARAAHLGPFARARLLLAVRCLPVAASTWVAAFMVLPSFLVFEPDSASERTSLVGIAAAAVGVALFGYGIWRSGRAWHQLGALSRRWMAGAEPFTRVTVPMPVYRVGEHAPPMTLLGLVNPILLVSQPLLDALNPEELNTAFEHEFAHRRAWDNLKRLAIRMLPDVLPLFVGGRRIEREWVLAAEQAADACAAWDGKARIAMASALVKAARLPAAERTALASPLVDADVITLRVERLLNPRRTEAQLVAVGHRYWLIVAAALVMLVVGTFADAAPFGTIHQVSEKLLERLP